MFLKICWEYTDQAIRLYQGNHQRHPVQHLPSGLEVHRVQANHPSQMGQGDHHYQEDQRNLHNNTKWLSSLYQRCNIWTEQLNGSSLCCEQSWWSRNVTIFLQWKCNISSWFGLLQRHIKALTYHDKNTFSCYELLFRLFIWKNLPFYLEEPPLLFVRTSAQWFTGWSSG